MVEGESVRVYRGMPKNFRFAFSEFRFEFPE
jgi:hypothetical protein